MSTINTWKRNNMKRRRLRKSKNENLWSNCCSKRMLNIWLRRKDKKRKKLFFKNNSNKRCLKDWQIKKNFNSWLARKEEWNNNNTKGKSKDCGRSNLISTEKPKRNNGRNKNKKNLFKSGGSTSSKRKKKGSSSSMPTN